MPKKLTSGTQVADALKNQRQDMTMPIERYRPDISKSTIIAIETDHLVAAPSEWNFFKPISDDKMLEMMESILSNGLMVPVIVWEKRDYYMVLAGHNRLRAYRNLYEKLADKKFLKIPCIIYPDAALTEEDARQIIIDTNWVTRVLTSIEKSKAIVEKYNILGRKKYAAADKSARDIIANEYGLKCRQVTTYKALGSLIPELQALVEDGVLSIDSGAKLSQFPQERQHAIFTEHGARLDNKRIRRIKPAMSDLEVNVVFHDADIEDLVTRTLKVHIPKNREKEIVDRINYILKELRIDGRL